MNQEVKPVDGPAVWRGSELESNDRWQRQLTQAEVADLEALSRDFAAHDINVLTASTDDAPLPGLASLMSWVDHELREGSGAVLLRGLPIAGQDDLNAAAMFLGLGIQIGSPMYQNARGDVLCHVLDVGRTYDDPTARAYQVPDGLPFHSDASDVVALLCLRTAKAGGLSRICSTAALHNEVLVRRPDLAPLLYEAWHFDRHGEETGDELPFYSSPICSFADGVFSMTFGPGVIRSAQRHEATPRLTAQRIELLELMESVIEEPGMTFDMFLEPGDVQLLLNYSVLHSRTRYEDWDEPERKRHLLRLWLKQPTQRPISTGFGVHYVTPQEEPRARLSELVALH